VLEAFDAEVLRAVFATNIFDFTRTHRTSKISPRCLRILLVARVVNPSMNNKGQFFRSVISQVTDHLLEAAPKDDLEKRRLQIVHLLCDAAAHKFAFNARVALQDFKKMDAGSYEPAKDLASAAAALGDIAKLRELIPETFHLHTGSEIFGYASANAARIGDLEMLAMILACDIQNTVNESQNGSIDAALSAACRAGQQHIVEYMLALPLVGNAQEDHYKKALHDAAYSGSSDIIRLLLNRVPAAIREEVISDSLWRASINGHVQAVDFLLDSGADINAWTSHGSPLHFACRFGHTRVVRLLLDRGAKYYESRVGDPLHLAAKNGHTQVAQMLLDSCPSIDATNMERDLHCAIRSGEVAMVRFFLENGVDVKYYSHALTAAVEEGQEEVVKMLLTLGVDIDGGNKQRDPPILRAKIRGYHRMVKVLLEHGAVDVDPLKTKYAEEFRNGTYPLRD
jgi:ankyrin repeat protein